MSLQELIELNSLVFGVEEPKIRPMLELSDDLVFQASNMNFFIYTADKKSAIKFYWSTQNTVIFIEFCEYLCLKDLARILDSSFDKNLPSTFQVVHIPTTQFEVASQLIQGTGDSKGDLTNYQFGSLYTKPIPYTGAYPQRFYLLEYDYTKLLVV